jgi:hypothetical protein
MIAFVLGFCGIDLFEAGPWAVGAHRGMRRRGGARRSASLLAVALGRVRGACKHGGAAVRRGRCARWQVGLWRQRGERTLAGVRAQVRERRCASVRRKRWVLELRDPVSGVRTG